MMKFKFVDRSAENEYYKLKEEHHWNNYKYFGTLATAHVVKGFVHDVLFKYYSIREKLSYRKYRKFLEKQW